MRSPLGRISHRPVDHEPLQPPEPQAPPRAQGRTTAEVIGRMGPLKNPSRWGAAPAGISQGIGHPPPQRPNTPHPTHNFIRKRLQGPQNLSPTNSPTPPPPPQKKFSNPGSTFGKPLSRMRGGGGGADHWGLLPIACDDAQ